MFAIAGCSSTGTLVGFVVSEEAQEVSINGRDYILSGDRIVDTTNDENNKALFGVISDIHGADTRAKKYAELLKERGVEGIIIPGDLNLNDALREGNGEEEHDVVEIIDVLESVAEVGLPVFVIPGNHETREGYADALKAITDRFDNVFDMTRYRVYDGDDVDFVSLPGYQVAREGSQKFIADNGFHATPRFIIETGSYAQGLNDSVVLITHGPPLTNAKIGPGTLFDGTDAGDQTTRGMMVSSDIRFSVSGHIHEAGGFAARFDGTTVEQDEWSDHFAANFGTLMQWKNLNGFTYDGMAGIIEIEGDRARFEMVIE